MKNAILSTIIAILVGLAISISFVTGFFTGAKAQRDLVPPTDFYSFDYSHDKEFGPSVE